MTSSSRDTTAKLTLRERIERQDLLKLSGSIENIEKNIQSYISECEKDGVAPVSNLQFIRAHLHFRNSQIDTALTFLTDYLKQTLTPKERYFAKLLEFRIKYELLDYDGALIAMNEGNTYLKEAKLCWQTQLVADIYQTHMTHKTCFQLFLRSNRFEEAAKLLASLRTECEIDYRLDELGLACYQGNLEQQAILLSTIRNHITTIYQAKDISHNNLLSIYEKLAEYHYSDVIEEDLTKLEALPFGTYNMSRLQTLKFFINFNRNNMPEAFSSLCEVVTHNISNLDTFQSIIVSFRKIIIRERNDEEKEQLGNYICIRAEEAKNTSTRVLIKLVLEHMFSAFDRQLNKELLNCLNGCEVLPSTTNIPLEFDYAQIHEVAELELLQRLNGNNIRKLSQYGINNPNFITNALTAYPKYAYIQSHYADFMQQEGNFDLARRHYISAIIMANNYELLPSEIATLNTCMAMLLASNGAKSNLIADYYKRAALADFTPDSFDKAFRHYMNEKNYPALSEFIEHFISEAEKQSIKISDQIYGVLFYHYHRLNKLELATRVCNKLRTPEFRERCQLSISITTYQLNYDELKSCEKNFQVLFEGKNKDEKTIILFHMMFAYIQMGHFSDAKELAHKYHVFITENVANSVLRITMRDLHNFLKRT